MSQDEWKYLDYKVEKDVFVFVYIEVRLDSKRNKYYCHTVIHQWYFQLDKANIFQKYFYSYFFQLFFCEIRDV